MTERKSATADAETGAARELAKRIDPAQIRVPDGSPLIWNAAVPHRPTLIARMDSARDVQEAIRFARDNEIGLSVLGGGHDWAGRAVRDGGLVIDMSGMRSVAVDVKGWVATIGGGATAADVMVAAAPYGLVVAAGTVGCVGMTGLTIGGGYGPLNGRFGLAADNLLSAEVVLADGRMITTDAVREPELFWALQGGGGNFGVVTSMCVRVHPLERMVGGMIVYPWSQAAPVWRGLREVLSTAPDELTVQSGLMAGPDGAPELFLAPAWSGDLRTGEAVVDSLNKLGTPVMSELGPLTYPEMFGLTEAWGVRGVSWTIRTRNVADYTADVIDALVEAGRTMTSPRSGIPVHNFHGASTRVAPDATAFANRDPHFLVEIVAGWDTGDGAEHRAWADAVSDALAPSSLPGGYQNLLGPDDHDQIADAYGGNAVRLRATKRRYDPDGVFTAIALPADHR